MIRVWLYFIDEEEENVKNLCEEAQMPLEQVMAKYQNDFLNPSAKKIKQESGKPPVSPFLRGRRSCSSGASSSGSGSSSSGSPSKCSTNVVSESVSESTESDPGAEDKNKGRETAVSSSVNQGQSCNSTSKSGQHLENSEADQTSDSSTSNGETKSASEGDEIETANHKATVPDSSEDANIQHLDKTLDETEEGNSSVKVNDDGDGKQEVNGEIGNGGKKDSGQTTRDCDGVTSSSTPRENGEVVKGESKGKSPRKLGRSPESTKQDKKRITLGRRTASALYHTLLRGQDQSDSDSDDEGDESFQGADR
jgi:protein phosphatase 1G